MKRFSRSSIVLSLLALTGVALWSAPGSGEVLRESLTFSKSDLKFSKLKGYDQVILPGCDLTAKPGEPQLPVYIANLAIPDGKEVAGVKVLSTKSVDLPGSYLLYPVQPPQVLSQAGTISFVEPKSSIYNLALYPQRVVEYRGSGSLSGYRVANFLVYPLQYLPAKRTLRLYSQIDFAVQLTSGLQSPSIKRAEGAEEAVHRTVASLVLNPEDVKKSRGQGAKVPTLLSSGQFAYVIITEDSYLLDFQPLADWKLKKGLRDTIVTTSWIYSTYPGYDQQEQIRNFIMDAYQNWGTVWVLLGGDTNVIPARIAYAMTCGANYQPEDEDSIPCDLYYSDLDGTWDLNGNHIYGEVADSVDMWPDVWVGRASVSSHQEAQAWVSKVLTYEKNPPTDYQLKMLFAAMVLWWDPYTDSGIGKDMIDDLYVPPRFDPITKLYESRGNESPSSVTAAMNTGQNIINHDGHGWIDAIGAGTGYLGNSDMDNLTNGDRQSILLSIGCWTAAIDYDCIAEHFITNPEGGGVAYIGNSRYGWGSPGNPGYGYSDRFDSHFYKCLFEDDIYRIGATLALDKAFYIPRAQQENVYRWCEYEINLLGDPEMPIWTDTPRTLTVEHPDSVPTGESIFPITVTANSSPLSEALVCVMGAGGVYKTGFTGANGEVNLPIQPSVQGTLWVTVTAHNYLPYEGQTTVFPSGPYVGCYREAIFDTVVGNGDGVINPGEEVSLAITLRNYGNQTSNDVTAVLSTDDSTATVLDSLGNYGDLLPGDSSLTTSYRFSVSPDSPNGKVLPFSLRIADAQGNSWSHRLNFVAARPILSLQTYQVDDDLGGDGDSIPEPGESFSLGLRLKNWGLAMARGATTRIWTDDPWISLTDTIAGFGEVWPDSLAEGSYEMSISSGCPAPRFPIIYTEMQTDDGYSFSDSLILTIGETGFSDDMETGLGGWSHSGEGNLWGISTYRSHSGSHSWYCGQDLTHRYDSDMNSSLTTPPFTLAPNSSLIFWHWYDVTTYGVDGLYVEVVKGSQADTLDFIGSGGALDSLLIGNDWLKENYNLSSYGFGDTVQVRFTFVSDGSDVAEGFYIDDVDVKGSHSVSVGTTNGSHPTTRPTLFQLSQNYPNPFNSSTTICYQLSAVGSSRTAVNLLVYNILGQEVRTLVRGEQGSGIHQVIWDGRDDQGKELASGIYLYRLQVDRFTQTRKLVFLK